MSNKALHIHTPKDRQDLKPNKEFLCLGHADGIDPGVLPRIGRLAAHVAGAERRLHVCGLRLPAPALPPPLSGQRPYDWGFRFPVLPAVFYHSPGVLFVRWIEDDGQVIDAHPHEVLWTVVRDAKMWIDSPSPCPATVARTCPSSGRMEPGTASVSAWVSNTMELNSIFGSPVLPPPPAGQWKRNFTIPADWGNQAGSVTTLYAQATDGTGSQDIESCVITFS
jgi:hypothetical protein